MISDVLEADTTNGTAAVHLKDILMEAFKVAQHEVRTSERPQRSLLRFSLNFVSKFLGRLSGKEMSCNNT